MIKVPHPSAPSSWIEAEAAYTDAVRAVGAPVPRLLGIELIDGRPASVWEHIEGIPMWQHVVQQPSMSAEFGQALADLQLELFDLVSPVTRPSQRATAW